MSINRFSSRKADLSQSFLTDRLEGAESYDRIAGYFRSSLFEVSGEALESVSGSIRIVCNSDLSLEDVTTAQAAQIAQRKEWCGNHPELAPNVTRPRLLKLYELLKIGKLQVKVLPDQAFGLIHGKAGVITLSSGHKTSFLGSVNESRTAWKYNYELIWEDISLEGINWVQAEFDALWHSTHAVPLSEFVIEDIERITRREVLSTVESWTENPAPAPVFIETPVYRKENGLWEHQKFFVQLAFEAHQTRHGARYLLADQVGLGKTIQLAMTAQLIALQTKKPIIILCPKPLIWQWQQELLQLLQLPTAVWTGKAWVDERGIEHPQLDLKGIKRCPRRIGIISTGLIIQGTEAAQLLLEIQYACVILDEAHKARRRKLTVGKEFDDPTPNNLLKFLQEISLKTHSLLIATATPVQLHPVEAWDLLDALNRGKEHILGNEFSKWNQSHEAIEMVKNGPTWIKDFSEAEIWDWVRNPLPNLQESPEIQILRRSLQLKDSETYVSGERINQLRASDKQKLHRFFPEYIQQNNPFIRHIVRRTRAYLEDAVNPETKEPYLKRVKVQLHGEDSQDALHLPIFLQEAYQHAESFCQRLGSRLPSGFIRTLLLRRVGSSMVAGRATAIRMLENWGTLDDDEDEDESSLLEQNEAKQLSSAEKEDLRAFIRALEQNQEEDPKGTEVLKYLLDKNWLGFGCIIFSQYYDSVWWLAELVTKKLPHEKFGIYAGSDRSGIMENGNFQKVKRDAIKGMVSNREMRLILGTDAASEGLNLQRLGTLINLDLPWNPSRLEQRKGRIQRIGQLRETVDVCNLRYRESVEDRVHELLSERLQHLHELFGQVPDVLEDVWVQVAMGKIKEAEMTIDGVPEKHPFDIKYEKIHPINWESCAQVLKNDDQLIELEKGWLH